MINFILHSEHSVYRNVIVNYFINPIMSLRGEEVALNDRALDNAVNVHFFLEARIVANVGLKGINVLIPHGIADKRYRVPRLINVFDYIITTGPAWNDKLVNQGIPKDRLLMGGYPKLDVLYKELQNYQKEDKPVVAWLPTHDKCRARNLSSYPGFKKHMLKLSKNFTGVISEHPANKQSTEGTISELVRADVAICDLGSTLYEAWALGKAVVFTSWMVERAVHKYMYGSFESQIYNDRIGYHATSPFEVQKVINRAVQQGMKKESKKFIDKIFDPALLGCSGKTILEMLENLEAKV